MIRTITRLLALGILLVSTGLAWWYFVELLGRTDFASHRTSVSYDTIWIMYATCIVAALLGGYVLTKRTVSRIPASVMLMAALIPTIGFAYLNISGRYYTSQTHHNRLGRKRKRRSTQAGSGAL